jgi:Tol biopolymer transport system component
VRGFAILGLCLCVALFLQAAVAHRQASSPPDGARQVTVGMPMNDEVVAQCSPDGRWLAFEYHETGNPLYPNVGIVRRDQGVGSWHPLLKAKEYDYLGDFSWSPDGRWLAAITGIAKSSNMQVVKIELRTQRMIALTHLPPYENVGPTTAWLRSGLIVFSGLQDGSIYGVPAKGGKVRKLVNVPSAKCGGETNSFAVSPDARRIAFAMGMDGTSQAGECNALWIADLGTGSLRGVQTAGLYPVTPFWLSGDTILFSGLDNAEKPLGIYSVSLSTGQVDRLLQGAYLSPFVCDSGKTLYFSWAPALSTKDFVWHDFHISNAFHGFHIWRMPTPTPGP